MIHVALLLIALGHGAAQAGATLALSIAVEGQKAVTLTMAEIEAMPSRTIEVEDHGTKATYRGVPLADLLVRSGLTFGPTMRGDRLSWYLLITAADECRVVYALPEIDPAFTDNVILLAYARDGKVLPPDEAPFRIVNPGDKRHARWVRQIVSLHVRRAP